ncbi:MAG: PQQ-binding-like beta-propeller repeat protein, partial [Gemmataceae bacterium]|nr:PQQ-binding-like beta-propeller repeat protein [Gemmataceae bacterium]
DRFRDPLPKGAALRLGFVRAGSNVPVNIADANLAAFSPDSKYFASVCHNRIHLWDVATGRVVQRFHTAESAFGHVRFIREGKWLLAQEREGLLRGWEISTGKEVLKSPDGMFPSGTTPVSPKGRWVVDGRREIWDLESGKKAGKFGNISFQWGYVFSPDERYLYVRKYERRNDKGEYDLEKWELPKATLLQVCQDVKVPPSACSADGIIFGNAAVPDPNVINKYTYTIGQFDTVGSKEILRLPASDMPFDRVALSPDGKRFAAGDNGQVLRVFDSATGKVLHSWKYDKDLFRYLAFSPDGKWLGAVGRDGTSKLCNLVTGETHLFTEQVLHMLTSLTFSRDGTKLVTGHADGAILFWDLATQTIKRQFRFGESPAYSTIGSLGWTADERYLVFQKQFGDLAILDWQTGKDIPLSLGKGVEVLGVSGNGRTLVVGSPRLKSRHDHSWMSFKSEQLHAARKEAQSRPELKHFHVVAATAAKETVSGRLALFNQGGQRSVPTYPTALSSDGKYALEAVSTLAGSPDTGMGTFWMPKGLRVVDTTTGKVMREFPRDYRGVVFAPDGRSMFNWKEGAKEPASVALLETRTGRERWRVTLEKPVRNAVFSPCGRWIAAIEHEGDTLFFLDTADGKVAAEHRASRSHYGTDPLAISPDGKLLARMDAGGAILLWNVPPSRQQDAKVSTAEEIAQAWHHLADDDAAKAYAAILRLSAVPKSALPILRKALLQEDDKTRLEKMVADLDSPVFADRQRATKELEKLGEKARPFLVKALTPDTPLEARRRIEKLLEALADPFATTEGLRQLRAIEVLERIGTADARWVLEELAQGAPEDPFCLEARWTLQRLIR